MECSRMVCRALALLGLILAAAPVGEAQQAYYVGNNESNPNWFPQQNAHFYQNWADGLTLYPNDTLVFQFDSKLHDVTQVSTASDLAHCFTENPYFYSTGDQGLLNIRLTGIGYYYYTSTGTTTMDTSADCQQGMHFYVQVVSRDSSAPAPPSPVQKAPPPAPSSSGAPAPSSSGAPAPSSSGPPAPSSSGNAAPPPPPDGQSGGPMATPGLNTDQEEKGKTTFPVAAVAVPIVIISIVVIALVGVLYCRAILPNFDR